MKLDVERSEGSPIPEEYAQAVSSGVGSLMQLFGLRSVKSDVRRNPHTAVAVVTDASVFDFAGPGIESYALSNAQAIASLAASAGIVGMSISDVSDDERSSLKAMWDEIPNSQPEAGRLAPPPDLNPDMQPIEVDL